MTVTMHMSERCDVRYYLQFTNAPQSQNAGGHRFIPDEVIVHLVYTGIGYKDWEVTMTITGWAIKTTNRPGSSRRTVNIKKPEDIPTWLRGFLDTDDFRGPVRVWSKRGTSSED